MKRFCALLLSFFAIMIISLISYDAFSQKKEIKAHLSKEHFESVPREGSSVHIELDDKSLVKDWENQLKTYGKLTKLKDNCYRVTEASVPGISGTCIIYSKCYSKGNHYVLWWSIDNGSDIIANSKASEKPLEEFARQQYINDVNEQIKDGEDAVKSAAKAQEKEVSKGEGLVKDVEKNGKEKIKLEEALKDNAAELVKLKDDIEKNKVSQKAASEEVAKMQKALEVIKAKLNHY
jgi:hypothetical protein